MMAMTAVGPTTVPRISVEPTKKMAGITKSRGPVSIPLLVTKVITKVDHHTA